MYLKNLEETMENHDCLTTDHSETDSSARDLFTSQTGQALITLGTLFKHIPPFNESIDQSTSDTLISIGKKLKGKG